MRLRYLRVGQLPPLQDVALTFGYERVRRKECAIHFVVGVNGSGKSRLLQALTEIFVYLERREYPPFPVTLAYDLTDRATEQTRTIYFNHPGPADLYQLNAVARDETDLNSEPPPTVLISFQNRFALEDPPPWEALDEEDWLNTRAVFGNDIEQRYIGELPGSGSIESFLPSLVLAYTSGATENWQQLFGQRRSLADLLSETSDTVLNYELERPSGWDESQELADLYRRGELSELQSEEKGETRKPLEPDLVENATSSLNLFVAPEDLKLALCAVTLEQTIADLQAAPDLSGPTFEAFLAELTQRHNDRNHVPDLRDLLDETNWLWPVTIGLRLDIEPSRWQTSRQRRAELTRLYQISTSVIGNTTREGDFERYLYFDLRNNVTDRSGQVINTATALFDILGEARSEGDTPEAATALKFFKKLHQWRQEGLLKDVTLLIRRRATNGTNTDLLLYENLSDGERVFLGRMALFFLLKNTANALVLLDEPETHFNDVWKRELVGIVDSSIGDSPSDVILSTHSSIALSDVFQGEIELLIKDAQTGQTRVRPVEMPTFGASPGEIMVKVFDAPDSIGRRSQDYLEQQLLKEWTLDERPALETLLRSVGFGYYRSELRSILRSLDDPQS